MSKRRNNFGRVALALLLIALSGVAMADLADERATEFLTALQNDDFAAVERLCIPAAKSYMPRLKAAWQQETALYGNLKSFEIVDRSSSQGTKTIIANLNFERPAGLAAQVSLDSHGKVAALLFTAARSSSEARKVADERVDELLKSPAGRKV